MIEELLKIIESFIRNIGGQLGVKLRRLYYSWRLKSCGKRLIVGIGTVIQNPKKVYLGDDVILDDYCQLLAGPFKEGKNITVIENNNFSKNPGEIHIGNNAHIGLYSIIQGIGGFQAGDYFTTSPNCKIYSLSNDYKKCKQGTYSSNVHYLSSPLSIGNNVWLGINVIFTKGDIGSNVFVLPNSIVTNNIQGNSIVGGYPAAYIKPRF